MTSITNNAEGGSDGTATTTGNSGGSSGTAWDVVQRGASATNEFDSAQAANGSLSYLIATAGTSTTAYNRWTTALTTAFGGSLTTHYGRFYFRVAALPAATRVLVEFTDSGVTATRATFAMLTSGAIRLRNAAGGTVVTFTNLCSVDTWYRVEYRVDGSTTGAYEMHLYAANSVSAIEDIVGGTSNFGGTIGAVQYGYVSNVASAPNLWLDGIEVNNSALPGPEVSAVSVSPADYPHPASAWASSAESVTAGASYSEYPGVAAAWTPSAEVVTATASFSDYPAPASAWGSTETVTADASFDDSAPPASAWPASAETVTADASYTDYPAPALALGSPDTATIVGAGSISYADYPGLALAARTYDCVRGAQSIARPSTGTVYRPDSGLVCRP